MFKIKVIDSQNNKLKQTSIHLRQPSEY